MLDLYTHEYFMKEALKEAQQAYDKDEVPVGAVVVCNDRIIARAHNLTEQLTDATAHAEMQAFTAASNFLGSKYLEGCRLYVTLEPCVMCAGAAFWTQLQYIIFGAHDPKRGFLRMKPSAAHPKTIVTGGIMEAQCAALLRRFFENKRGIFRNIMKKSKQIKILALSLLVLTTTSLYSQSAKAPIMGWSSWNNFGINIDEAMIRQQADALVASGLYDAGYRFINIDDGYFGGRDASGQLLVDSTKFPSGLESLVEYIHAKNLKAGIYSDAGRNTCGSMWQNDANGIDVGLYGHLEQDCQLFFDAWGFDFLKVDWCGAEQMELDEETEYSRIIDHVKSLDSTFMVNVCRWQFPGEWVTQKADSWRISGDIEASFGSILHIIDLNAELYKYASAGHYNDMDMLQVGRGMSYDEDKTHFSMWCMLNSPLLAGNDLRAMSAETIEILTNREVIALNQDSGYRQASRISSPGDVEIWLKLLGVDGEEKAVALMNRGGENADFFLSPEMIGVNAKCQLRDLWRHENIGKIGEGRRFTVPAHGVVILKTSM